MANAEKIIATPPILLAIETSGICGSVSLVVEGACITEYSLASKLTHSQRLLAGIDWIMKKAKISWEQIDGIAISLGPGSFTGLRIGLSTAKGLAMASNKPLLGVSSLDGLANQFIHTSQLICPILDARKKEVYTALYRCGEDGSPKRISNLLNIRPEDLAEKITEPTVLVGDGLAIYGDFFKEKLGNLATIAPAEIYFARAAIIGKLAIPLWRNNILLSPEDATPIYVRASDAELQFGKAKTLAKV